MRKVAIATDSVAQGAKEQVKSELPQTSIEVLDSQTVTAAEGFIALAAARELLVLPSTPKTKRRPVVA